jgi:hypothetical protein
MDAWEGSFGWQGYAREGRPDILNYLHQGDVTWEEVWGFYRSQQAEPEVILRIMGLFHAFTSTLYDREGCRLEVEGEAGRQLRAWAAFAVERMDVFPEERIQQLLCRVGEAGLITGLYYNAAYQLYTEAMLDRYAAGWRGEAVRWSDAPAGLFDSVSPAEFPDPEERLLAVYYPEPARFPDLKDDPDWDRSMRAFLAGHYQSWNRAYAATYCISEEEAALLQEVGGEG